MGRHYNFLEALFLKVVKKLKHYEQGDPQMIASRWYEWMKDGSTPLEVGSNRRDFYAGVVSLAKKVGMHVMIMGLLIMLLVGMQSQAIAF
ncbi:MAG TPA: hypothetical protein VGO47_02475 [Chlamydiales bacterium]|nr:hypothetical protein [Chlamydiales bacterium]